VPKMIEDVPLKTKSQSTKIKPTSIIDKPLIKEPVVDKPLVKEPVIKEATVAQPEAVKVKPIYEDNFLSGFQSQKIEKPTSKIAIIIPVLLWLSAIATVAMFAYYSNQKTVAFDHQILENAKSFQLKDQFKFPQANLPKRRNEAIVERDINGKVLPISRQTNELDALYYDLPDDLRPVNPDEVKTLMWLDCKAEPVGRFNDGSMGFQEKCHAYLVDRQSSKFIGVQDFLGVPPALSRKEGTGDETGKVPHERYISYLKEKQPEADRSAMKYASDSPDHHYFTKSEFVYAIILLCLLGAIGLGWMVYQIKSAWNAN
jgi:hypothetical protein